MNLTNDMLQALADLNRAADGVRGPGNTGLSTATYKALERRGLLLPKTWRKWKLSALGRETIQQHLATV